MSYKRKKKCHFKCSKTSSNKSHLSVLLSKSSTRSKWNQTWTKVIYTNSKFFGPKMTIFWIFSAKTTNSIYNKVYMVREAVLYCPGFVGSFESITWSISVFDTRIKSNWLKNENQYDSYWGTFWNYWGLQIRLGPVTGPRLNFNKQGCAFSMVLWPDFLMWQYRVNDHPYHAPQFIIPNLVLYFWNRWK